VTVAEAPPGAIDFSGERLRELRKRRGISRQRFAAAIDASITSVAGWERGIIHPGSKAVARMCAVLACSPNDLFAPVGWQ
jgi:transcriptional regulator with XRE-family HTH domain